MSRPKEYAYYYKGEYVMSGKKKELSEKLGLSVDTLTYYVTPSHGKKRHARRHLVPLDADPVYVECDIKKLKRLVKANDMNYRMLSEWAEIKYATLKNKTCGDVRFSEEELSKIANVLRVKESELLV